MTQFRYRRVRPSDKRWQEQDAGTLLARRHNGRATAVWRFVSGRYRLGAVAPGEDVEIAMPYPRAEPGKLSLRRWIAPWHQETPRFTALSDLGAELVWLVPGLLALMPQGPWAMMTVALVLSALALRYAARFRHQRAARSDNIAVHGRFWDRILDLPSGLIEGPPHRQAAAQSSALDAALNRTQFQRRAPVLATLLLTAVTPCFAANGTLAAVLLAAALLGGVLAGWLAFIQEKQEARVKDQALELGHKRGWVLTNMIDLRSLSVDAYHLSTLAEDTDATIDGSARLENARLMSMLAHGWIIILGLGVVAFTWLSGIGTGTPREALIVFLFGAPALHAAAELGRYFGQMKAQIVAIAAIAPIMDVDVKAEADSETLQLDHIKLDRVAFSYTEGVPILKDVDLELFPQDIVALSGPSGFGKSTLLHLLMGLVAPTTGTMLLNGKPLTQDQVLPYRRRIAAVFQDQDLGFSTVRNAVLQDMPGAGLAEVWDALDAVGLGETIRAMPMGVQTLLVAGAFPFSLMQQILIARALIQKPDLLVLDETLSALDVETARSIVTAARSRGAMVVFSTHRLDLLDLANKVVRLGPQNAS